ncbi:MAG: hypothetical protein ACRDD8_06850 [Bacteroidales bacterium]
MGYKVKRMVKLDSRVEGTEPKDIILVSQEDAKTLRNGYKQMQIGIMKGRVIFNYNAQVLSALKKMGVCEE